MYVHFSTMVAGLGLLGASLSKHIYDGPSKVHSIVVDRGSELMRSLANR